VNQRVWYAAEAIIPREASEAAEYGLMEAGALGTETRDTDADVAVLGYFETSPDIAPVRAALLDALRIYNLAPSSLIDLRVSEIADRDWLAEWKKDWQPVEVGRFIIAPPWIVSEPGADRGPRAGSPRGVVDATGSHTQVESHDPLATARGSDTSIVILIEPGMAFGTGTHETTRLCLKGIEKHFRRGSFLDVGTGTGILAIAAAKMFPDARIEACDTDAEAIEIAKENARLNGVRDQITFRVGTIDEQTLSADLVCANLTAPVIVDLLPSLLGATCGHLVLSGILDSQIDLVQSCLLELGATTPEIDQDGEWVALVI
jgi:ribosomal protein L11 methyltransferase